MMERRLAFANIPESFKDMRLKTFNTMIYQKQESRDKINLACKIIKNYMDNFDEMQSVGLGLYISSQTKGSGKTRMAASIANELMEKHQKQVKFAVSSAILSEIKSTWSDHSECSESTLLNHLVTTEILIIDDFGMEKATEWINNKFYQIINERYNHKKITMFTSNIPLPVLNYDERIKSRVEEITYQIEFPEESVRKIISENNNKNMLQKLV